MAVDYSRIRKRYAGSVTGASVILPVHTYCKIKNLLTSGAVGTLSYYLDGAEVATNTETLQVGETISFDERDADWDAIKITAPAGVTIEYVSDQKV